jgi:predicted permease
MWKDLQYGLRSLRHSPVFTIAAVLSLALGIGANTAIFSLLDQVVLRSLPVSDPERLVVLHGSYSGSATSSSSWSTNSGSVFPYPLYRDLRDRVPAFSGLLARAVAPVRVTLQNSTQAGQAEMVTGNYFATLGVRAAIGRTIVPEDDGARGANPVAVLSHAFWTTHLAANPAIVNHTVGINGHQFVVIGVASPEFNGLVQGDASDLYVPISMQREVMPVATGGLDDRTYSWLNIFGRLKAGESLAKTQAATDVVFRAIREADLKQSPVPVSAKSREEVLKSRLDLRPAARGIAELSERWEKPLTVLMTMVGLVLLVACANVAGLLVARATARQKEIAIRLALGATRFGLIRQLLVEGVLLAIGGAIAGVLLKNWATSGLLRILPQDATSGWVANTIDWHVLGYSVALSLLCAVLFALAPAVQATSPNVAVTLKDQASAVSRGNSSRLRRALVMMQVALSLLLVVGAGLFTVSASKLLKADRGFHTERLAIFSVDATLVRAGTSAVTSFYHDLLQRLAALPEQSGVAAGDAGPYAGAGFGGVLAVEAHQADGKNVVTSSFESVSPGYLRTLGIGLRAGREFDERDTTAAPKAVLVNEAFVKKYFANQNPLGRHVSFDGPRAKVLDREIVGIVADVTSNPRRPAGATVYFPYTQREAPARLAFYVRVTGDEGRVASAIRRVVREADAGLPVPEIKPVELKIRDSLYTSRLVAAISVAFGILATLLAVIGLYGVIAFAVARRTAEIGVRIALGAPRAGVVRLVMFDAGQIVAVGIAVGLGAAFVLSRYVESQLFGVQRADLAVYVVAAGTIAMAATVAAFVPAWRASRIDPVTALRCE